MRKTGLLTLAIAATGAALFSQVPPLTESQKTARDIYRELIEVNTTDSVGSTTVAAEAMGKRLRDAGFPDADIQLLGPDPRKGNLVVRIHGSGRQRPVLFIGHLDVVEARREDWSTDPFKLVEKDGFYYGRGTMDMKNGDAALVSTFIRLKREGWKPSRDIILALTADEEGGLHNGVDWLVKNHRDLIDAEFVINPDGGEVRTAQGKPVAVFMEATEKLYADYRLEVTNPGGHSSRPLPDNAIYHLADALGRLEHHQFPFELNPITRAYFAHMAMTATGREQDEMRALDGTGAAAAAEALSTSPVYNSMLHTTCVATRLDAGHANNALPQRARAVVNCRILPGHSREEVREELVRIVADPQVSVSYLLREEALEHAPADVALPPPPPRPDVVHAIESISAHLWPGAPLIPIMATGASDGVYTNAAGMPTYTVSGAAIEEGGNRAHGKDERLAVKSFDDQVDFYYELVKMLTK